jgi:hypothetical protein
MPNEDIHKQQNLNKEELTLPLLINETKNCGMHNSNEKTSNHIYYIRDFISKFSSKIYGKDRNIKLKLSKLFQEEIERGIRKHKIDKIIEKYMDFVKKQIKDPKNKKLFGEINDEEIKQISDKIENHIMRHTYKTVFPNTPSESDKKFYQNTRRLDWIKPEHLEIKKLYVNQLKFA